VPLQCHHRALGIPMYDHKFLTQQNLITINYKSEILTKNDSIDERRSNCGMALEVIELEYP
jgi:hypothetical protein